MCIIVHKPAHKEVALNLLRDCWDGNRDGAGLMFPENGKVVVAKGFMKWKSFKKYFKRFGEERMEALPMTFHFRIATHGSVGPENCHPFKVHDGLYFAHNGIISNVTVPKEEDISDTETFAREYLAALHAELKDGLQISHLAAPKYYGGTPLNQMIGKFIGGSKLVFMDGTGDVSIVNEGQGVWDDDIWFSNRTYKRTTSFGYGGSKRYGGYGFAGSGSAYGSARSGGSCTTIYDKDDAEERRHEAAQALASGANVNALGEIDYYCKDCWQEFKRKNANRISYLGGIATLTCPDCRGDNTIELSKLVEEEAGGTYADDIVWECYDCEATFWPDESSAEVKYDEATYLVCPWCAGTRTYCESDYGVVERFGDDFFDGDPVDDDTVAQARLDFDEQYGKDDPPPSDMPPASPWDELERQQVEEWNQLLEEIEDAEEVN